MSTKEYWNFSFTEFATYDITAFVSYIKKITKNEKVHYMAHSEGGGYMLAKIIEDPEF
jgi:hypothetical protein